MFTPALEEANVHLQRLSAEASAYVTSPADESAQAH